MMFTNEIFLEIQLQLFKKSHLKAKSYQILFRKSRNSQILKSYVRHNEITNIFKMFHYMLKIKMRKNSLN